MKPYEPDALSVVEVIGCRVIGMVAVVHFWGWWYLALSLGVYGAMLGFGSYRRENGLLAIAEAIARRSETEKRKGHEA